MQMVREAVSERLPSLCTENLDKSELLTRLEREQGAAAVVEVGLAFRELPPNPVFHALATGSTPHDVFERWMRLERFGHTHHRTRPIAIGARSLLIQHYGTHGRPLAAVNDLFVWGLLIALFERADVSGIVARLSGDRGPEVFARGRVCPELDSSRGTAELLLTWEHHQPKVAAPNIEPNQGPSEMRVRALLQSDLLRTWKVDEVARRLGYSVRALQRQLAGEGVTFSDTVHRARVEAARRLLDVRDLSLTEVAFCVGFADVAHFSRTFRKVLEIPPTAYLELRNQGGG
jgi:AraC-like DNA-binding protein